MAAMPPMMPPPIDIEGAPPSGGPLGAHQLELLRELRAEAQDLLSVLASVRTGETTVKTHASYIQKTKDDIAELLKDIEDGEYADTVRHLHNLWEQMIVCPMLANPAGELKPQEQLHHLNMLDGQIQKLVFWVGFLTIPSRVNGWLGTARPGYYIPFHVVFEDELPAMGDRVRVLNFLAWAPEVVKGGIVDAANGLIYRYADDRRHQLLSLLLLVAALALSVGAVYGACRLGIPGWPIQPTNLPMFLAAWGAVLVGMVAHVALGSVKRTQTAGGLPPIIAVGDLLFIIDARIGQILLKLLLAMIGFFGVAFTAGVDEVTPLNAFLIGYTLDSFLELFGLTIEQRATAQVAALKKQLGVATE